MGAPSLLRKGGEMGAEGCRGEGRDFEVGYAGSFRDFGWIWNIHNLSAVFMWIGFW